MNPNTPKPTGALPTFESFLGTKVDESAAKFKADKFYAQYTDEKGENPQPYLVKAGGDPMSFKSEDDAEFFVKAAEKREKKDGVKWSVLPGKEAAKAFESLVPTNEFWNGDQKLNLEILGAGGMYTSGGEMLIKELAGGVKTLQELSKRVEKVTSDLIKVDKAIRDAVGALGPGSKVETPEIVVVTRTVQRFGVSIRIDGSSDTVEGAQVLREVVEKAAGGAASGHLMPWHGSKSDRMFELSIVY